MPNTATVTGSLGPGLTTTAQVYSNVTSIVYDFLAKTVAITDIATGTPKTVYYEYANIVTVTMTISGGFTATVIST